MQYFLQEAVDALCKAGAREQLVQIGRRFLYTMPIGMKMTTIIEIFKRAGGDELVREELRRFHEHCMNQNNPDLTSSIIVYKVAKVPIPKEFVSENEEQIRKCAERAMENGCFNTASILFDTIGITIPQL